MFCLESLAGRGIAITVSSAKAVVECLDCGCEYSPDDMYQACRCGSLRKRVLSGRDITVDSIEIKEIE